MIIPSPRGTHYRKKSFPCFLYLIPTPFLSNAFLFLCSPLLASWCYPRGCLCLTTVSTISMCLSTYQYHKLKNLNIIFLFLFTAYLLLNIQIVYHSMTTLIKLSESVFVFILLPLVTTISLEFARQNAHRTTRLRFDMPWGSWCSVSLTMCENESTICQLFCRASVT